MVSTLDRASDYFQNFTTSNSGTFKSPIEKKARLPEGFQMETEENIRAQSFILSNVPTNNKMFRPTMEEIFCSGTQEI
jgi:hypothetical protein